ncbi:MAG: YcaO-like family protein [Candidatus Desulfofervidaceae bacterium]|nr:YcaO-like family protein [Candidatus Desulfofervidaceae bacterium]
MLTSSLKTYTYGQDKACVPEETVKRVLTRLRQGNGPILQEIISLENLDKIGIPVYTCKISPDLARTLGFEETFGKGITPEQAQASALMELVERYSGFRFLKDDNFLISPYLEVKEKAIAPDYLLYPFPSVYREREILETLSTLPLSWTEAYSFTQNKKVFFPLRWFYRLYGTTGWAAGNSLEEAILQALGEIIERHCVSVVIEERQTVPTIDINSIENSLVRSLIDKIFQAGMELTIKDLSLNLGIPTVAVIAHDPEAIIPTIRIYAAAGTHLNPEFALIRALIELTQHRAQMIYRETIQRRSGGPTYCFPKFKTIEEADFLLQGETISFASLPCFSHSDFKVEIEYFVNLLAKQNLEVFVVETTHKMLGMPAVIVAIPGARLNRPSTKLHPYLLVARQLMDIGLYREATTYLERALEVAPIFRESPQIICQVAVCYQKAGKFAQAANYFRQALELAPRLMQSPKFVADFMEVLKKA